MDFITVELFGITWFRPNNLLTNILVGMVGIYLFLRVDRKNQQKDSYLYLWMGFFLLVGLGGTIGGFAHAFNYDFPEVRHTYLHKIAWSVGGAGLFLGELAAIQFIPNKTIRKVLQVLSTLVLLYYIFFLYYSHEYNLGNFNHFDIVRFHSVYALLVVILPIHIFSLIQRQNTGAWWVIGGIATLATTVIFYNYKISFHEWFDFNDISHFLEIICLILMCIGILEGYEKLKGGQLAVNE